MNEKEIRHYFNYLLLKNIPAGHGDHELYKDCCDKNIKRLRKMIWDIKENRPHNAVIKYLDVDWYTKFIENMAKRTTLSLFELEKAFHNEKHKFLKPFSQTYSTSAGYQTSRFFSTLATLNPNEKTNLLNQFIFELRQVKDNPKNEDSRLKVSIMARQFPVKVWFRKRIAELIEQWEKRPASQEKMNSFMEIHALIESYSCIPELKNAEVLALPIHSWRKAFREFLTEEILKSAVAENKMRVLAQLEYNISLALTTGAATAF